MAVFRQRQATGSTQRGGDTQRGLAAGLTATYGVAVEADTALSFVHSKLASYGIAAETDGALSFIADRLIPYGVATETDSALAFVHAKLASYGIAAEIDVALAFTAQVSLPSFFLPPVDRKVPAWERLEFIGGYPSSARFGSFLWTWLGRDVVISGITYQGGRWNGPLTAQQVTDITAAGYGTRIYSVSDLGQLPAIID